MVQNRGRTFGGAFFATVYEMAKQLILAIWVAVQVAGSDRGESTIDPDVSPD
jgi:hypothetical protein